MPDWQQTWLASVHKSLRLAVHPRQQRHGNGVRLGMGAGASLEFHDHRGYVAGDDPRHIDWRVYARSEQLVIRRYRQEISPKVEIILDLSASMGISHSKSSLATTMAALFTTLALQAGTKPNLMIIDHSIQRIRVDQSQSWHQQLQQHQCQGRLDLSTTRIPDLQRGADRILISDGLYPAGGLAVIKNIGQESGRLSFIEVLSQQETEPQPLGTVRMQDVEGGFRDMIHDEQSCKTYQKNLHQHRQSWNNALSGRGPGMISCNSDHDIHLSLQQLTKHGLVEAIQ